MSLPANNTNRAFVTYTADTATHTLMVRVNGDASDSELSEEIGGVLDTIGDELSLCTFVKFERAAEGSDIRLPATWSGPTTWGSGDPEANKIAWFWSFTGKDPLGHKTRVDFFGRHLAANDDYRVSAAANATIANTIIAMNDAPNSFLSIASAVPFWNQYANESYSQHWVGEARK